MKPELELAAQLASEYVESLDDDSQSRVAPLFLEQESSSSGISTRTSSSVTQIITPDSLVKELNQDAIPPVQVIQELNNDANPGLVHTGSGRYFGFVIGGTLPVSIAADWLTSAWDQNAGAYAVSPSSAIIEQVTGEWIKELLNLPKHASFAFVTGCQMAHVTCLAAARHHILLASSKANNNWDVETQGLCGAPPIRILVTKYVHETILRALRLLGIGTNAIEYVATNNNVDVDATMDLTDLTTKLQDIENKDTPTIVSLAAGELNTGVFDDFDEACDICHKHGAWVHVDGAFGLWVAAAATSSERFRHLVRGVNKADSWATDAHKILNVPHDSGIAIVANREAHRASMTMDANYLVKVPQPPSYHNDTNVGMIRDQYEWGPEWSRRARGISIYATLRSLGKTGVEQLVEQCCDLCSELVERLGELPGVQVLARPIINQGLVRFLDTSSGSDNNNKNHDMRTDEVIKHLNKSGEVWFGGTKWNGMRVMRISVCSHRTNRDDISRAVAAVKSALQLLSS